MALNRFSPGRLLLRDDSASSGESDVFEFDCTISSETYDSHSSRFHESSLKKFVDDINGSRSISFLDHHQTNSMQQVLGRMESAQLDGTEVTATVSMLRDTETTPEHLRVDEHIRRIERGYFSEVSVGYSAGQDLCDLCGLDVWRMTDGEMCPHWPGDAYDGQTATYTIHDAGLREVSLVYRGANPDALIHQRREDADLVRAKSESKVTSLKRKPTGALLERDGERYRWQLLERLCEEGTRAMGAKFDEKAWRERFANLDSVAIQDQIDIFMQAAEGLFPKGRQTRDTTQRGGSVRVVSERLVLPAQLFD